MLRNCALRLCLAWLVFSALGFLYGSALLGACTPLLSAAVRIIAPALTSHVALIETHGTPELLLDASVARPLQLDATHAVPTGQPLPSRANVVHVLVPLVIFFSALCAMPVRGPREWTWLALLAIPLAGATLLTTAPFQLVGLIEMAIQQHAVALGIFRPEPWTLKWMLFLEGGGRWVLPIAFAVLGFALSRRSPPLR